MITRVAHPIPAFNVAITSGQVEMPLSVTPRLRLVDGNLSPQSTSEILKAFPPAPLGAGLFGARPNADRVLVSEIKRRVCAHFQLPLIEMTSDRRGREVARPRQVAMYLSVRLTRLSKVEIGKRFGNRDHTTVMHAERMIERLRSEDESLDWSVLSLELGLGNG